MFSKKKASNCPVMGCQRYKGKQKLLCWDHWMELPTEMRKEIDEHYARGGWIHATRLTPKLIKYFREKIECIATKKTATAGTAAPSGSTSVTDSPCGDVQRSFWWQEH